MASVVAGPPIAVSLAKTFVVNFDISTGSVLDSFSFFNSSVSDVGNVTLSPVGPMTMNFAVQPTGPNSGKWPGSWAAAVAYARMVGVWRGGRVDGIWGVSSVWVLSGSLRWKGRVVDGEGEDWQEEVGASEERDREEKRREKAEETSRRCGAGKVCGRRE